MTDEQIKVLKELRDEGVLAGCIDVEEQKALTAALEYIRDMREIEAAAVEVMFNNGRGMSRDLVNARWFVWGLGSKTPYHESLCEAFKKEVKGGKE